MMRAGAGRSDITPAPGTHLSGDGMGIHRPARSVFDPLYARALVVESGERRICLLTLDLLCVTLEYTQRIREAAARQFGFKQEAILVHSAQNHSSPSLGNLMLDPDFPFQPGPDKEYIGGAEKAYGEMAVTRSLEAIAQACGCLRPVQMGWGRAVVEGLAFNRRAIRTDGAIGMPWFYRGADQPLGPTGIRCIEGPFDPEVGVVAFRGDDMRLAALLLHFSCHPVNVYATDKYAVSGDWPGAWSAAMRESFPDRPESLVLNGCCGNLNPWPAFTPDFVPDHRRMGGALAERSRRVVERLAFTPTDTLDWRMRCVPLDYRDVPDVRRQEADRVLRDHPSLKWDAARNEVDVNWFLAASTKSIEYCRKRWPRFPYEIQVFRIGDAAIVGLPGEPFVEGQLAIKVQSPAACVQVAHMSTQYVGYMPTREACARGGHEANDSCTYWAKLAPDSLDVVVDNVKAMIKELFA